ncbi:hypothetical protein BH09GEM1_BH09GEM1_01930 [soil metagenome]
MTTPHRTIRSVQFKRAATAVIACGFVYACGTDTASGPLSGDEAAKAANTFTQLADSIARSGGDSSIARAYGSLADALRTGMRVSPVTITVDGVATPFLATAQQNIFAQSCLTCAPAPMGVLRSVIAWQASDPKRVVQVSSEMSGDSIRAYLSPTFAAYTGRSASLVFFDGKGGAYFGTTGIQHATVYATNLACVFRAVITIFPAPPACTNAEFVVDFSATAEPSTFLAARNPATGTHRFAMDAQTVLGVGLVTTPSIPQPPPINLPPRAPLPATLGITVDSIVTLTLTVSNPASTPATVLFGSGLHADFTIYDASTAQRLWQWSAGKLFTQVVSADTVPAKGQLVYTTLWQPTKKGLFTAVGSLVSRSHVADTKVQFTVP